MYSKKIKKLKEALRKLTKTTEVVTNKDDLPANYLVDLLAPSRTQKYTTRKTLFFFLIVASSVSLAFTRIHTAAKSSHLITNFSKNANAMFSAEAEIYLGFESSAEPYETMPPRAPDPNGTGNGCMGGESWNEFYKFNVCVSPTAPLSDYALERSSQYARYGNTSLRCYLKPTDINSWPQGEATHRAELAPHHSSPVPRYPLEGEEMWYGISYYFPNDFVFAPANIENDIRFIITQWQHGSPGSPIIALEVMGDHIVLQRKGGQSENSTWFDPETIANIQRGQWMDVVVQAKWSKSSGTVNIWVNGSLAYSKINIQTIYTDINNGGGFKIGLYYWRWKVMQSVINSLDAGITYREIFIDEVREYHGTDGYAAVAPGASALPIELLNFDATVTQNESVEITWQTASEINNENFFIERSQDGTTWEEIVKVPGAGTSADLTSYQTIDKYPYSGISYYRLLQIDFDGQFSYSTVKSVELPGLAKRELVVYPNPVSNYITIEGPEDAMIGLQLYNSQGQNLTSNTRKEHKTKNQVSWNLSTLPAGIYTLKTLKSAHQIFKK